MAVKVLSRRCPQNHSCPAIVICKAGALSQTSFKAPVVDETKCVDCLLCVKKCPMGAFVK